MFILNAIFSAIKTAVVLIGIFFGAALILGDEKTFYRTARKIEKRKMKAYHSFILNK